MTRHLRRLWNDENGATAVEYALVLAGIAAVIITIVISLGGKVQGLYATTESQFPSTGP